MKEMLKDVVVFLKEMDKKSKGHTVITLVKLSKELNYKENELKDVLKFLNKKNMLVIYNGINNKHIKWNNNVLS